MARSQTSGGAHQPTWPSVEEQLAASKVIHGSALEKLIRDNQDLSMLRPEEAHDKLGLPPWLRVYWRKQHPEGVYAGPSGGYPLVLHKLYEWMMEHQDLPAQKDAAPNSPGREGRHGR
jgi:hypothetical protein